MEQSTTVQKFLRSEMSFYGTIAVTLFSIMSMYFGLKGGLDLQSQKLDFAINGQNQKLDAVVASLTEAGNKITAIEIRVTSLEKDTALLKLISDSTTK